MNDTTPPTGAPGTPGGYGAPEPQAPFGSGFFSWLRGLGITRGGERWFAGVAGGIAARANIDPLIVRGVFVVLALLGGPGLLLYIAGWLLLPDASGRIHLEEVFRGRAGTAAVVGTVAVGLLVVLPFALPFFGATAFGGWDLWHAMGMPGWLATTVAVLVWIAVFVGTILLIGQLVLRHGRTVRENSARENSMRENSMRDDPASGEQPQTVSFAASGEQSQTAAFATPAAGFAADSAAAGAASAASAPGSDTWADRISEGAERFGERATQWSEQVGKQADEWSARYAEQHDRTRLGTAHGVLTLALALLAAGAAALWALNLGGSGQAIIIAALLGAVPVLAVSLIIAGVRGRHTGWVGFLSFCGVIALVFTAMLPAGSKFQPFGVLEVGSSDPGAMLIAGSTHIEVDGSRGSRSTASDITVWHLFGTSRVEIPENTEAVVRVYLLAGNITGPNASGDPMSSSGPLLMRVIDTRSGGTGPATSITVYMIGGNVRVLTASGKELLK